MKVDEIEKLELEIDKNKKELENLRKYKKQIAEERKTKIKSKKITITFKELYDFLIEYHYENGHSDENRIKEIAEKELLIFFENK